MHEPGTDLHTSGLVGAVIIVAIRAGVVVTVMIMTWGISSPSSCHRGHFLYLPSWQNGPLTQVFHITPLTLSAAVEASGLCGPAPLQTCGTGTRTRSRARSAV